MPIRACTHKSRFGRLTYPRWGALRIQARCQVEVEPRHKRSYHEIFAMIRKSQVVPISASEWALGAS